MTFIAAVGIIFGALISLSVVAGTIWKAGKRLTSVIERKIEDTATEVAAQINLAVVDRVTRVERQVARVERRVVRLEEHVV